MSEAGRVVGIDLGTTHTVVAWTELGAGAIVRPFPVEQLVSAGEVAAAPLLPSALYAPLEGEPCDDRWGDAPWLVGAHARSRAGEVPARGVISSKSWLSYAAADRTAAILPWQAGDEEGPRLSPVEAAARILRHVRAAWDRAQPETPLAEQDVVLTVPASFDAVARQLTVQAAADAGLCARLLEEPQAAFYDLMRRRPEQLDALLGDGADEATVLVCDVGGGTTDLSLIRVRRTGGAPHAVDRIAVGRHLLLGGDNMDLALAHLCEPRLAGEGERLPPRQFAQLVAACRAAREQLLGPDAPDAAPIRLLGSGSKLVGATLKTTLARDEVEACVLDGFFPRVSWGERARTTRSGIVAFGLPYEREVAVTRHVAAFLRQHTEGEQAPPLAGVLLNGGVFAAPALVARLLEVISSWGAPVGALPHADPLLSVACGAVAYGLSLRGMSLRIGGGSAQGYYLGLGGTGRGPGRAVCVLPRGAEEGTTHRAEGCPLELVVGQPVRFDLYAGQERHAPGEVVTLDARYGRLPPLVATLEGAPRTLPVTATAELTAVGTLDVACLAAEGGERFALAFDVRGQPEEVELDAPRSTVDRYGQRLELAQEAVRRVFGKSKEEPASREVKDLVRNLEKIAGKRLGWSLELNRALFDLVCTYRKGRRRSPDHERQFWSLAGFCLRPGVGDPRDELRVRTLFELFEQRLAHAGELRSWQQFWITWRRVAAGLSETSQEAIRDVIDPFLAPAELGLKKPKAFRNEAEAQMLDLAASLERVDARRRAALGDWVLERTWTDRDPRLWAALGKIGARAPIYASVHQVISPRVVERWMDHLLRERWDDVPTAPRAAVAMCRLVDDRARDVSEAIRAQVKKRLDKLGVPDSLSRPVTELVAIDEQERVQFYGEDLPVGIRLAAEAG